MRLSAKNSIFENVREKLLDDHCGLISEHPGVANYVNEQCIHYEDIIRLHLIEKSPFPTLESNLLACRELLSSNGWSNDSLETALNGYINFCRAIGSPANENFWKKQFSMSISKDPEIVETGSEISLVIDLFFSDWTKKLDEARARWEFETIRRFREEFYAKAKASLDAFQKINQRFAELGLALGWFFDLSEGKFTENDILEVQRWARYLQDDEGVQRLCELLGRLRQIQLSEKIERVSVTRTREVRLPDINSKEEIVGIRLGRDLEYALPSELALLSDSETALLFDLKFIEARLMCFDMNGIQSSLETYVDEIDEAVEEQDKLGPIIICVDTSGSMQGMPETIAKAVTLFMLKKAKEQKRDCFLINFSTQISTINLGRDFNTEKLIKFLSMSFSGGTDAAPALCHALEVMESDMYEKADLIMISDFVMGDLNVELLEKIEQRRNFGNRFYSLVVGESFMYKRMRTLFDHEWIFNPMTSKIQELDQFQNKVSSLSSFSHI